MDSNVKIDEVTIDEVTIRIAKFFRQIITASDETIEQLLEQIKSSEINDKDGIIKIVCGVRDLAEDL